MFSGYRPREFFNKFLAVHAEDWGPLQFLVGEWVGESGSGQPGQSSAGSFSFTTDLQETVLIRKSFAEYLAAEGRPAFRHEDLTIVYRDSETKQYRATYWDNEGHVIQYGIKPAPDVAMTSEGPATALPFDLQQRGQGPGEDQVRDRSTRQRVRNLPGRLRETEVRTFITSHRSLRSAPPCLGSENSCTQPRSPLLPPRRRCSRGLVAASPAPSAGISGWCQHLSDRVEQRLRSAWFQQNGESVARYGRRQFLRAGRQPEVKNVRSALCSA